MPDLANNSTVQNNLVTQPIYRMFEIVETTVAGIKIGSAAVNKEVMLGLIITNDDSLQAAKDDNHLGEIEINHSVQPEPQLNAEGDSVNKVTESIPNEVNNTDPLGHHYLASEPITPTKDEPYPKYSPLLASN